MRVKTERKRSELVAAATEVFLEQGYERTQMSHVSDRAKCSKGTLYSYFVSKEALFYEVVMDATSQDVGSAFAGLDASAGWNDELFLRFGVSTLQAAYSPRFQALRRLVFSTPAQSALGRTVYETAVRPYLLRTAEFLASAMAAGYLRSGDPEVAASHLSSLLESELLLKFLLHALEDTGPEVLEAAARRAITAFLAAYRPSRRGG